MTKERAAGPRQQSVKALLGIRDLILKGEIEPG